ncbi:Fungalysin metallopeptidase-domain-containing protein [Gorgonomyces haynaldii]|nr:Fungalysin metallopeptidase-domain-containing protein [Gorgonomyces haynaldii]
MMSPMDAPIIAANTLSHLVSQHDLTLKRHYQTDDVHHCYYTQTKNGLEIVNAVANVNLDSYGQVLSIGQSLYKPQKKLFVQGTDAFELEEIFDTQPAIQPLEGLQKLFEHLRIDLGKPEIMDLGDRYLVEHEKYGSIPIKLAYLTNAERDDLDLVWDMNVDLLDHWYHAHVDTQTGQVKSLVDWVSHSSFNVFPVGTNDPHVGPRELLKSPEHRLASPLGWNTRIVKNKLVRYNSTMGNNVYAQSNPDGGNSYEDNYRPSGGPSLNFDFPLDLEDEPEDYLDAAITNLFYWNNIMHDLFYVYGFNEEAGNFQDDNFERGGKGGDAVIANAQDGSGYNNANFATPPDGYHGRMRMYVWTATTPKRDGDLEAGIVIHEYAHGISTRLTGGPDNSGCLGWGESGGMGEGWGDTFATALRTTANSTRHDSYGMGVYSAGGKGIRNYAYSTSKKTNPSTYAYIRKPGYWGVHAKGEVWAEILYEVYWNLVDKLGWEDDWFDVPVHASKKTKAPKAGNKLFLRLLVDGLKLQPCYPTFIDARDAILLADHINTKGQNQCTLWEGFAKRGLGVNAEAGGTEDFTLPKECTK